MKPRRLEKNDLGIPLKRWANTKEIAHSAVPVRETDYYTGRISETWMRIRI